MFKPSLVGAFLIGGLFVFARAQGQTVPDSPSSSLKTLETSLSNLDASPLQGVQTVSSLEETPASGIRTETLATTREDSDPQVVPQYDLPGGGGNTGGSTTFPVALVIEILGAGVIFVGAVVLLFRYAAKVIYG
ncbi:MAG TPA: hypothetical protein VMJ32_00790 [Pirellulales bacterium]|nr:hypothetical protein [Pirellulales bacterium]